MADPRRPPEFTEPESTGISAESRAAARLDAKLARDLNYAELTGPSSEASYLSELRHRDRLSRSAEQELVIAAKRPDAVAREQLIETFLPNIAGLARVYRASSAVSRIELIQEGVVGLLRALDRYDPDRGVPFWAYASWWVRQAQQQLIAELTRPTVLSDRTLRQLARVKRARATYARDHGHEPTVEHLAQASELTQLELSDLMALDGAPRSLDERVSTAGGDLDALGDLLADPTAEAAYQQVLDDSEIEQIRALLISLNERERQVLRERYGINTPERSLREIGDALGLSAERVRQIEQRALGKLRAAGQEISS